MKRSLHCKRQAPSRLPALIKIQLEYAGISFLLETNWRAVNLGAMNRNRQHNIGLGNVIKSGSADYCAGSYIGGYGEGQSELEYPPGASVSNKH